MSRAQIINQILGPGSTNNLGSVGVAMVKAAKGREKS